MQMRKEDNTKFYQMMAGVIRRDLVLSVEDNTSPFAELSPEEKRAQVFERRTVSSSQIAAGGDGERTLRLMQRT